MKRSSLIVVCMMVLLALGTFAAACGSQSAQAGDPKQTIEAMLQDMKKGDAAASYALLSKEDKKQITAKQWSEALSAEKPPADLTWKITKSEVDGDKAVVTVTISAEGESQTQPFALLKENGKWKVSYVASSNLNQ